MELPGSWWLLLVWAWVAEIVGTMAGFGAATILTPIAAFFVDIKTAIVLVACFHLFGNASRLIFFGRHIDWTVWGQFGLTGLLCGITGALVTAHVPAPMVRIAFGVFLLVYVGFSVLPTRPLRLPKAPSTLIGGGALSGFIAGLLGTGGAIRSACLMVFDLPKEAYLGTSAAIALMVDATRLPVYLAKGLLPSRLLPLMVSLVGVAFAGAWVGQKLVRRVSASVFRRVVLGMLTLMALKMLWDGFRGVV